MLRLALLTRYSMATFFHANLTPTVPQAIFTVSSFIKTRPSSQQHESELRGYQNYLSAVIDSKPQPSHQALILLDHVTALHSANPKLSNKRLSKIHNSLTALCLPHAIKEGAISLITLLTFVQRYHPSKAISLFKTHKNTLLGSIHSLPVHPLLVLNNFLKVAGIHQPMILEPSLEVLYPEIPNLSQYQLQSLLLSLASSKKFINRQFLTSTANRILQLFKTNNFKEQLLFSTLAFLSEIQHNNHSRSIYIHQLDDLYEHVFPVLTQNLNRLNDAKLNRITTAIRRSRYYDSTMVESIAAEAVRRQIDELSPEAQGLPNMRLTLRTFVNILHMCGTFNHLPNALRHYTMSITKLLAQQQSNFMPRHLFVRLLWALCVLFPRHQLRHIEPILSQHLSQTTRQNTNTSDPMTLYHAYLYLRTTLPLLHNYRDNLISLLASEKMKTQTSQTQMDVHSTLLSLGIAALTEYNLNNILCDIMIPEWENLKNIIIEVHGFGHFCRNTKRLTGNNILKQKIVRAEMYRYYFISLDEWLIAEDKKQFMRDFIEEIQRIEEERSKEKEEESRAKSSRWVRGGVRKFRPSGSSPQTKQLQ